MPFRLFVDCVLVRSTVLARVPQIGKWYVVRLRIVADKETLKYAEPLARDMVHAPPLSSYSRSDLCTIPFKLRKGTRSARA